MGEQNGGASTRVEQVDRNRQSFQDKLKRLEEAEFPSRPETFPGFASLVEGCTSTEENKANQIGGVSTTELPVGADDREGGAADSARDVEKMLRGFVNFDFSGILSQSAPRKKVATNVEEEVDKLFKQHAENSKRFEKQMKRENDRMMQKLERMRAERRKKREAKAGDVKAEDRSAIKGEGPAEPVEPSEDSVRSDLLNSINPSSSSCFSESGAGDLLVRLEKVQKNCSVSDAIVLVNMPEGGVCYHALRTIEPGEKLVIEQPLCVSRTEYNDLTRLVLQDPDLSQGLPHPSSFDPLQTSNEKWSRAVAQVRNNMWKASRSGQPPWFDGPRWKGCNKDTDASGLGQAAALQKLLGPEGTLLKLWCLSDALASEPDSCSSVHLTSTARADSCVFKVDASGRQLSWASVLPGGEVGSLNLTSITRMTMGKTSSGLAHVPDLLAPADFCWSLRTDRVVLGLQAGSKEARDAWCEGLRLVCQNLQSSSSSIQSLDSPSSSTLECVQHDMSGAMDNDYFFRLIPLFPHSCDSNASVIYNPVDSESELQLEIRATVIIEPGDPIEVSYDTLYLPTERRRAFYRRKYGFECKCIRCENPDYYTNDLLMTAQAAAMKASTRPSLVREMKRGYGEIENSLRCLAAPYPGYSLYSTHSSQALVEALQNASDSEMEALKQQVVDWFEKSSFLHKVTPNQYSTYGCVRIRAGA